MASSLTPTFGMFFLGQVLQAMLYGMALLQVYLYFFWYRRDTWFIRISVVLITIFESFEMAIFTSSAYSYLIDGFGNFHNLTQWNWQVRLTLLGVYLSTYVAQFYFAHCIYRLHWKDKITPALILVLATTCFGAGIGQVVRISQIQGFQELGDTTVTRTLQAVSALTCDILITGALCWRLNASRTGIQSTNKVLNYLIMTAINRGVMTMISAGLNIILFSAKPGTFYFMLWVLLSGKFYMNSMMAMLNTRTYAAGLQGTIVDISMSHVKTSDPSQSGVSVAVTREAHVDNYSAEVKYSI